MSMRSQFLLMTADMFSIVNALAILSLGVTGVLSQACTQDVQNWEQIDEDNYDRNYSSIDAENGRPLGFARASIYYSDIGLPNPCIKVMNIDDTRVEVMAESNPPGSKFCVKDQYDRVTCDGRIYDCLQANREEGSEDSITFEFFCDSTSCDETDVSIFYRFTVSPPASELDPELFCDSRDTGEYPSSLNAPLPTNRGLATLPPDRTNGATPTAGQTQPLGLMLLSAVLCLMSSGVLHM